MAKPKYIPLKNFVEFSQEEMIERSSKFVLEMKKRRTIREFSDRKVDLKIIKNCIKAASFGPTGANLQPYHFVIIENPKIKKEIRISAEHEEHEFYTKRAPKEWLEALSILGTNENKPFLEKASCLIAVFSKSYDILSNKKTKQYYAHESTGIACGILIMAIHHAGLVSLTHTPSPMNFLNKILNRPKNEKPFLLLVVGYPNKDAKVPEITKKSFDEISTIYD